MPRQKRGRSRAGDGTLYRTTIQASSGRRRSVWVAEVQWTAPDGRRFRKSAQRVTRQGSLTIAEALDAFVAARAPRWRPSTQRHYRAAIRLCLARWLKRRVIDLRREDVSALLASAHSATLARAAYMQLKAALRPYARFMINDPFLFAAMPSVHHLIIQPLDASEVRVFLDVARGERLYALFALALAGGLRLGHRPAVVPREPKPCGHEHGNHERLPAESHPRGLRIF